MTPGEIADVMTRWPRRTGEELTDWFDRVMAKASQADKPRLPYREPGEDDE